MAVKRLNGIITGRSSMEAELIDAMGGGLCKIHGKFFGHGKNNLRACPKCDIEEYFKKPQTQAPLGEESLNSHGIYGEDQFKEERELPDCSYECYAGDCKKCDGIGCDCLCHTKRD